MSNLAKLKKKAAELEQKKQFDKALALYVQMLEEADGSDEADVALYNRVGDLLLRQGNVGDALGYYEKAVDLYAEGGFFNNAIALCNKILRQSPGRSSIYYKLGKISAKKGFNSDAKANFLEYADRMQKAGQIDEAFRALKEFAELCPDQEDVRLMLAEQLAKKGRRGEALEQLQSLYDRFESEGRSSEARATVDRMKAIDPEAEPVAGNVPQKQKSSDLVFLDVSWDEQPKRPMRATVPLRPPAEAKEPEPPRGGKAPLADLPLLDTGERDRIPVTDDRPTIQTTRLDDDEEGGDVAVGAVDGLTQSMDFDAPAEEGGEDDGSLLGLEPTMVTDTGERAAILAGNVLNLEPPLSGSEFASLPLETPADSPAIRAKVHDLALPGTLPSLGATDDEDEAEETVPDGGDLELIMPEPDLDVGPVATRGSLSEYAPPIARRDSAPPAAGLEPMDIEHGTADQGFDLAGSGGVGDLPLIDVGDELELGDASAPMEIGGDASRLSNLDAVEPASLDFAADSMLDGEAPDVLPTIGDVARAEPPARPRRTEADVARRMPDAAAVEPSTLDALADLTDEMGESPLAPAPLARRSSTSALAQSVDGLRARAAAEPENWSLRRELGEALLDDGDREAGLVELDAAMIGFERLGDLETARSVAAEIVRVEPNSVRHHQKGVEYAFRTNDKLRLTEAYVQLADSLFRTGQQDKARAVYQRVIELAPEDARAKAALAQYADPVPQKAEPAPAPRASTAARRYTGDAAPPAAAARASAPTQRPDDDFVNLGDWLRDVEAPKSTRMVVDEEQPTGDEEADFAEMLRKFKQGVAENVEDEDHESHYDLGVAFKEMGLLDEAIAEFQKALRGAQKRVRTYEALGQCFIEKKQFQIASTILQRALIEGHGDDQLVGVLYLLGFASEATQQWAEAIGFYQRVFAVDIQFRDVTERLTNLEQRVAR